MYDMDIHSPDDELDERWKAMHEHPELAQIPNFDALDLVEKAHAKDTKPGTVEQPRPKSHQRRHSEEGADDEEAQPGGLFEDGPHQTPEEQAGHELIHEEYQNWLSRPRVIEVDDYPL